MTHGSYRLVSRPGFVLPGAARFAICSVYWSNWIFAAFATAVHVVTSALMVRANSSAVLPTGSLRYFRGEVATNHRRCKANPSPERRVSIVNGREVLCRITVLDQLYSDESFQDSEISQGGNQHASFFCN